jgi:hypothetical protein
MSDKGSVMPEDDLRAALAPDGSIASLDPARVIAGARRRRKVRGLATTAVAAIAVAGVATGGFLAGGRSLGQAPEPADAGPTTLASPNISTPPATPGPPTSTPIPSGQTALPLQSPGTSGTPGLGTPGVGTPGLDTPGLGTPGLGTTGAVPVTAAACRAAAASEPGPGATATQRSLLGDETGTAIVIADRRYWTACDNTFGQQVTARRPARLKKPSPQDTDAFAVAGDLLTRPAGEREFYWAGGMLPDGVATVRYTFPDGATEDAAVHSGFWLMRHVSERVPPSGPPTTRIRVRLLSASGAVVNEFPLTWGRQTCAQISHGC